MVPCSSVRPPPSGRGAIFPTSDIDGLPQLRGPAFTAQSLLAGIPAATLGLIPGISPAMADALSGATVPTTTAPIFAAANNRRTDQWSQEFELRSGAGSSFTWVVGAIAFSERGSDFNTQMAAPVIDVVQSVLQPQFGALAPLLAAGLPQGTRYRLFEQPESLLAYRVHNHSYALFGQVDVPLGKLILTGGLRLTHDLREIERDQNGVLPFAGDEVALNQGSVGFTRPTGHFGVNWRVRPGLLAWTRIAKGYLSGGWNARQVTRAGRPGVPAIALQPYEPETLWSLESGFRWRGRHAALSGTLFRAWRRDGLTKIAIPDAPTFGTVIVMPAASMSVALNWKGRRRSSRA